MAYWKRGFWSTGWGSNPRILVLQSRNIQHYESLTGTHRHSKVLIIPHGNAHHGLKMGWKFSLVKSTSICFETTLVGWLWWCLSHLAQRIELR
jgi:hypothetical protein